MKSIIAVATAAILGLSACSGSHVTAPAVPGKSVAPQTRVRHLLNEKGPKDLLGGAPRFRISVKLFDAPLVGADASNSTFNAGILGVDAIDSIGNSWQLIAYQNPNIVNLLSLQADALDLGNGFLPVGSYPAVQLLLDSATTTVTYNGTTYPVKIDDPDNPWWDPTGTVVGVTVPLNVTGGAGDALTATLDFNVFESADLRDGIVHVTPTVVGGIAAPTINGSIVNMAGGPVSNATVIATDVNGNVANTTVSGTDGSFHLHGISPGGYTITVVNRYTTESGARVIAVGYDRHATPSTYVVVGPNSQVTIPALTD